MPRSTTLLESRAQLRNIRRYVKNLAAGKVRDIALGVVNNLHDPAYVPVDTGWLLANTVASVGSVPTQTIGTREQARRERDSNVSPGSSGLAQDIRNGVQEILEFDGSDLGKTIYIANNVPYAPIVNAIHKSKSGFFERAIDDAIAEAL